MRGKILHFHTALVMAGLLAASGPALSAELLTSLGTAFTPAEQRTVVNFLLQNDLGKAVEADVEILINAHDRDCAVRLVMDAYNVPQDTAELFIRLHTQPESATPARKTH